MIGLDHIVLLFAEKAMLRRKKCRELTGKGSAKQIPAVMEPAVGGGLV
jgi:hypothetical protein